MAHLKDTVRSDYKDHYNSIDSLAEEMVVTLLDTQGYFTSSDMYANVNAVSLADVNGMLRYINWNSTDYVSKKRVLHYGNLNKTQQKKYYSTDPNFIDNSNTGNHEFINFEGTKAFVFTKVSEYDKE